MASAAASWFRVLFGEASGSTVRVLTEWTAGESSWGTVGVSTNRINARWAAVTDAMECKIAA